MPIRYRRLVFDLESGDADALTAALWEHGTLGVELREEPPPGTLVAYFDNGALAAEIDWRRHGARLLEVEEFEERDWMAAYRERVRPIAVGRRLLIDPREPERSTPPGGASSAGGRHLLRLPARTAFGTGGHESTRLVLELLEQLDLGGAAVLDLGAGSGILSFAAELYGAALVVGVEIDPAAALVAAQNRRLNALHPHFVAGGVDALRGAGRFDLALVNVLPERVAADLDSLRALLRPGAAAVFSGILGERRREVGARLERAGFRERRHETLGEWTALLTGVAA